MSQSQWVISDEIDRVKIDHAAQKSEHHEINEAELHDDSEKGKTLIAKIPHHRMHGKKDSDKGKREQDFCLGELVHWSG